MSKRGRELLRAVASGRLDLVAAALRRGASPDARDAKGEAPLFVALQAGNIDAVRMLLDAGASPNLPDHLGVRPLVAAIRARAPEAVRMLVEAGAEVSPRERYHCNLPIIVAANVGDAVIFEMLLEGGADPGPYEDGPYVGYVSALDLALILGRLAIARQLFARGFDPNARSSVGTTALMTAAAHGHLDLVDALLEIGATVDAIDARGRTATIYAVAHNLESFDDELVHPERHRAVIARLLEVGADPGHEDAERRSLVAWAELRGDPAIIALVRGAEPR